MLGHLTFLFEPRSGTSDTALTVQTRLCKEVLDNIILAAAHKLRAVLTAGNWDTWLRLLIGVVDSIFMNKAKTTPPMHNILCRALSAPALRVLLEVLLLSQNRDPAIWNSIVSLMPNWIRVSTIQHWSSVSNALTLRVLSLMYGPKFGSNSANNLFIDWIVEDRGSVKSTLVLDHDFVFFAWRRFMALLPEPQTMTDPEVYRSFFYGVSRMVEHYIKVMDLGPHCPLASKQKLPNGNTVLALLGRWLFNALLTDRPGSEDGTSSAAYAICKLFCRTPTSPNEPAFQPEHLAALYASLSRILVKNHTDKVLSSVILSAKNIFIHEFPGSELLIPPFLFAGAALWREAGTDPNARSSFIDIISSLCCIADHFKDAKLFSKLNYEISYGSSARVSPVVAQFQTVRSHLQVLLSVAISKEENPRNIVRLLHVVTAFLHDFANDENNKAAADDYALFMASTISEICRKCREVWNPEVVVQGYAALSSMADLVPLMGTNANMTTKLVVRSISDHLTLLTNNAAAKGEEREALDKIIHRALLTLTDWWMTDPNLPASIDAATIQAVVKSIVACLGLVTKSYLPPSLVRNAAEFALFHFTSSANFPLSVGPQRVSSEISEEDILKVIPNVDSTDPAITQHARYFLLDDSIILTLIDVPGPKRDSNPLQEPQQCDVYIIIRDIHGRHVWKTQSTYYEREDGLNPPYDNLPNPAVTKDPLVRDRYEQDIQHELYHDLINYLNSLRADRTYPGSVLSQTEAFVANEKSFLQATSYGLDVDIRYRLPEYHDPYVGLNTRFQFGRVFLSNLGLATPETFNRLVTLDARPGFVNHLKTLDNTNERSYMSVGVVLMQQMPKKPFEYLADQSAGPQDYQDFVASLGWGVNLWDHTGYRGPLVPSATGDYAPYYANYCTEVIFTVANWIPNAESVEATITKKRKALAASPVLIVWSVTGEYEIPATSREYLHIVIQPMKSGLYRVRLVTRENRPSPAGPLVDNMKLSKRVLGPMVRATAIACTRHLQPESAVLAPTALRKAKIDEFSKLYTRPLQFDDWMLNLMSGRLAPEAAQNTGTTTANASNKPPVDMEATVAGVMGSSAPQPVLNPHSSIYGLSALASSAPSNTNTLVPSGSLSSRSNEGASTHPRDPIGRTLSVSAQSSHGSPPSPRANSIAGTSPQGTAPISGSNHMTAAPASHPPANNTTSPTVIVNIDGSTTSAEHLATSDGGSESGEGTPKGQRSLSTSSGHGDSPQGTETGEAPSSARGPPSSALPAVPAAYKGPATRTPPPPYNPQPGTTTPAAGTSTGAPAATANTPPPANNTTGTNTAAPSSPGTQGGATTSAGGPTANVQQNQQRKGSGFSFFKSKDKDKDKKPEEKKDPKKK